MCCFTGNVNGGFGDSVKDQLDYEQSLEANDQLYHRAILRQLDTTDEADFAGWLPENTNEEKLAEQTCLMRRLCCMLESYSCCCFKAFYNHHLKGNGLSKSSVDERTAMKVANTWRNLSTIFGFVIDAITVMCFLVQFCIWGELNRLRELGVLPWSTNETTQYGTRFTDTTGAKAAGPFWENAFMFQGFMLILYTTPAKMMKIYWGATYRKHFMREDDSSVWQPVWRWFKYMHCRPCTAFVDTNKSIAEPADRFKDARDIARESILERLFNVKTDKFAESRLDDFDEAEWKNYNTHLRERRNKN